MTRTHPSPRAARARELRAARRADHRPERLGTQHARAATPRPGGDLVIARTPDSTTMDATSVFDNESIWVFEQIDGDALHRHGRRQGRQAVARDELHLSPGQADLHVPPAQGRDVPQRQGDDRRRRQVLDRRRAQHQGRLGLHRRRDQERDRQGQVPVVVKTKYKWAPLVADIALFSNAIIPTNYGGKTKKRVLQRAGRHRPVQVGSLDARQGDQARQVRQVLAEGQAVPEQRDLDERARRQHAPAAAQGRPGADRRVPGLGAGQAAADHLRASR